MAHCKGNIYSGRVNPEKSKAKTVVKTELEAHCSKDNTAEDIIIVKEVASRSKDDKKSDIDKITMLYYREDEDSLNQLDGEQ